MRLALLSLATLGATLLLSHAAVAEKPAEDTPLVVKIHADWCGTCRALNPTWDQLQSKYGDSLRFVVLDVTNRSDVEAATAEADRLDIRAVFDAYKSKTGTIAVLNGRTHEVVEVLKGVTDATRYDSAIQRALES
jgi:thiol-disulfide isomerase/thioredoxin